MRPIVRTVIKGYKLQAFVIISLVLLFYRLFFYSAGSVVLSLGNSLLFGIAVIVLYFYLKDLLHAIGIKPLAMVINLGILNAFIFFLLEFSGPFFNGMISNNRDLLPNNELFYSLASFIYAYLILGSVLYIFLSFKELYFFKRRKNDNIYYNTMFIFIILSSLSIVLKEKKAFDFIPLSFYIITISLIIFNSLKISWIAFIVKKEKVTVLIISMILSIMFLGNMISSSTDSTQNLILTRFSPALAQFLKIIMLYGIIYFSVLFFTTLFHIPTAEAYDRKAREVSSLQYFSKLITEVLDIDDLANKITELAIKIHSADAAWLALEEDSGFKIIANNNIDLVESVKITNSLIKRKENNIIRGKIFNVPELKLEGSLSNEFKTGLLAPLKTHNRNYGYLIVVNNSASDLDDEDKDAINTFADYASVAIDNAELLKESIEKERLEKELDVAREIQRKILPSGNPEFEKLKIASVFIPAFEVGGDYMIFSKYLKINWV